MGNGFKFNYSMKRKPEADKKQIDDLIEKMKFYSENFLRSFSLNRIITDTSGQPVDFEFVFVSKTFETTTGFKKEKLIGQSFKSLFSKNKLPIDWVEIMGSIALNQTRAKFNYYSDHLQKWFSITAFSLENGYFVANAEDITSMKKSEMQFKLKNDETEQLYKEFRQQNQELANRNEKLALLNNEYLEINKELRQNILKTEKIHNKLLESEETARGIVDAAADIIALIDTKGTIIDCNESLIKGLRLPKDKLIGKIVFDFFPPEISMLRKEAVEKVLKTGEKEFVRDTGEDGYYETIVSPCFDKNKNVNKLVIIARNITDRYKIQYELQESEKRYRLLAENSEDVIWTFDIHKMKFSYISPSVYKLRGITVEEALSETPSNSVLPEYAEYFSGVIKKRIAAFESGDESALVKTDQIEQICRIGIVKPVEIVSKLITDENGKVIEILGVSRDFTKRKQIENDLKKALERAEESDRLKSAFLANMSHEIRTPMNGIVGFADLLSNSELDLDKRLKYAEIINVNSKHLLSIINDIIDISKIESGQVTLNEIQVDINSMFDDLLTLFSSSSLCKQDVNIRISSKLNQNNAMIYTDEIKLKQVLTNIINNALKFTDKGSVEFGCRLVEQDKKPYLLFIVADTGIGIAKANHSLIFDRFRQVDFNFERNYGGTGLGLPISKAFIELMGGKIWVDSDIGKGAKFYFIIPYMSANKTDDDKQLFQTPVSLNMNWKGKSILIAEDDNTDFYFLSEILTPTGVKILRANNGNEAVEICKKDKFIELVLMDIKMPEHNGFDATRTIKATRPGLPIIVQTAFAFSNDLQQALDAGCDDYISKPILKEYLLDKLNNYLV